MLVILCPGEFDFDDCIIETFLIDELACGFHFKAHVMRVSRAVTFIIFIFFLAQSRKRFLMINDMNNECESERTARFSLIYFFDLMA